MPIFNHLVLDSFSAKSGCPIDGITSPYFVVESWIFKDTPCYFAAYLGRIYFEETLFFGADEAG
jgi:hypothetical protein